MIWPQPISIDAWCLWIVQYLIIRSGYLYEFVDPKAAKKWYWQRRYGQIRVYNYDWLLHG